MQLTVSGLDSSIPPLRFKHLWGRYVYGFKPWTHCIHCLKTNVAKGITPTMVDTKVDRPIQLEDRLFYLCGVGDKRSVRVHPKLEQRVTNVHIAVYPQKDSSVTVTSAYGVTFTIDGARRIEIQELPVDFGGLPEKHYRCKNFQFGYQMFEVGEVSLVPGEIVCTLRNEWALTPGMTTSRPPDKFALIG